jgi:hypothetical protein
MKTEIIKCDICTIILSEEDINRNQGLQAMMKGNVRAKSFMNFTYNEVATKGDLCLKCATKIKEYLKQLKTGGAI